MEPNVLLGYLEGVLHVHRVFLCMSKYPYDGLDQNNLTHGVYKVPNEGIAFLLSFVKVTQYFSKFQTI